MQAVIFEATEALTDNDDSRHGHDEHSSYEVLSDYASNFPNRDIEEVRDFLQLASLPPYLSCWHIVWKDYQATLPPAFSIPEAWRGYHTLQSVLVRTLLLNDLTLLLYCQNKSGICCG